MGIGDGPDGERCRPSRVAEEIVREVKSDLVGKKKKIGADTGAIAEQSLRNALITLLSKNHLDFDEYVKSKEKPVKILFL